VRSVKGLGPSGAFKQPKDGGLDTMDVVATPAHFGQFFQEFTKAAEGRFAFGAACQAAHDCCAKRQF